MSERTIGDEAEDNGDIVQDDLIRLLDRLREALAFDDFAQMTLGDYRGKEEHLEKMILTPVVVKGRPQVSVVSRYKQRDVTTILPHAETIELVTRLLDRFGFRSSHLFTADADLHLRISKKGKLLLRTGPPSHTVPERPTHDRTKERPVDVASGWLQDLGITTGEGLIKPTSAAKWKQINRFVEIVEGACREAGLVDDADHTDTTTPLDIVDFGSGKGYLTFAVHERLAQLAGERLRTTGVEARSDLVELCRVVATKNRVASLRFIDGTIAATEVERIDIMIALHACDTATDDALDRGVGAGARVIIAAPCCHKAIRPQITIPDVLRPMLRYGKHLERQAEMLTDTIRALRLELAGYTVKILEFVPIEHTPKNSLIVAVKSETPVDIEKKRGELEGLVGWFGVGEE